MPNRILKDSINESRGLTSCSFFAQDLYKRLITYADDYGRFNADPQIMVARLYPRELAVVSVDDLYDGLIELVGVGKITFYTSAPRKEVYGAFPNWSEHQRMRESKKKNPDPSDTRVNDWYLRRFIPIEMKVAIIERDGFKCKICGKHIAEIADAKRLVKMGTGMFHIDHIIPCQQGGRATMENLRLTCPKCNLSRKKMFNYDEILDFAANGGELPQVAESIVNLPLESNPNPIQSEYESNTPLKSPQGDTWTYLLDESVHESFKDFIDSRKKMRSPMTPKAMTMLAEKLNKLTGDPKQQIDLLNEAIEKGWKSVYPHSTYYDKKKPALDYIQKKYDDAELLGMAVDLDG